MKKTTVLIMIIILLLVLDSVLLVNRNAIIDILNKQKTELLITQNFSLVYNKYRETKNRESQLRWSETFLEQELIPQLNQGESHAYYLYFDRGTCESCVIDEVLRLYKLPNPVGRHVTILAHGYEPIFLKNMIPISELYEEAIITNKLILINNFAIGIPTYLKVDSSGLIVDALISESITNSELLIFLNN